MLYCTKETATMYTNYDLLRVVSNYIPTLRT